MTPTARYRAKPGGGFVWLIVAALASVVFFGWGLRTPPLERVWQMQLELMLGSRGALSRDEVGLLRQTLERNPGLADNMLKGAPSGLISANTGGIVDSGYAYALRRAPAGANSLVIVSPIGEGLTIRASVGGSERRGTTSGDEPFIWQLPGDGPFPQLVEVRLKGGNHRSGDAAQPMTVKLERSP